MYFIYNFPLFLCTLICSPFIILLLLIRRKYRIGFFQKCGLFPWGAMTEGLTKRPIWIHAVSVGEVMAAVPLIRELKKRFPDYAIILSTVTATGNKTARSNAKGADRVIFFPFDYPFIVKWVVKKIRPQIFITLETEIWPNFLRELSRQDIPSFIISGRISRHSFRNYYIFRFFFKRVLKNISFFCMQSHIDASRIIGMGADEKRVIITGNIKFDQQIPAITEAEREVLYRDLHLTRDQDIFIAGSTHRGEEEIILEVYSTLRKDFNNLILLLAPRHPDRFEEVEVLLRNKQFSFIRRTAITNPLRYGHFEIILLDTIGELAKIYSIGTLIFVGGSLVPVGGHNVLEPAVFKKPVLFGPYMLNFSEIVRILKKSQAAIQVHNKDEFVQSASNILNNRSFREEIGQAAFHVIEKNSGALKKSMEIITPFLEQENIMGIKAPQSAMNL